ncbi:MAG TPA: molybdopterin biosynthesis protein, partial [candidate division WOR-3 bacterium]|nr:molybdopterin biosynthesis protein [candidate division WOR-3 bacterium]
MKRRKIYLKRYEIEEAREIIFKTLKDLGFFRNFPSEVVDTRKSLWRTTKNSVYAKKSVPEINISAMDGIATRSLLTKNASEANPIYLQKEDFIYINTGNPVPDRFDCVVKIEDVWESEKGLEIRKPVRPFENIRLVGEDLLEGDLILEQRRLITPEAVSLFISADVREIEVLKRIKIAIIPTGNEIVEPFNPKKE